MEKEAAINKSYKLATKATKFRADFNFMSSTGHVRSYIGKMRNKVVGSAMTFFWLQPPSCSSSGDEMRGNGVTPS